MKHWSLYVIAAAALLVFPFGLHAQVTLVDADDGAFPNYTVTFNVRQPDRLDEPSWQFRQGAVELESKLDTAYRPKPTEGTDFLFLIENAPFEEWKAQLVFFKQLIAEGLPAGIQPDDRFFVAHFDWKVADAPVLKWIIDEGVSDATAVVDGVNAISRPPTTGRLHRTTELFPAIDEGLRTMNKKRREGHPAAIVVFSREVQNIYNATPTESDLATLSKSYDIPVYAIGYPPADAFRRYISKVQKLVELSYGQRIEIEPDATPQTAAPRFSKLLNDVHIRAAGWNYRWEIETSAKPGSGTLGIEVVAGSERGAVALPVPTFWDWIWKDSGRRFNAILVFCGALIVLGLLIFWLNRRRKKQKTAEDALRQAEIDRIKSQTEQVEQELKNERERQEQESKEQAEKAEQKRIEDLVSYRKEGFSKIRNKPFLIGSDGSNYELKASDVIIGRGADADIRLNEDSVSKKHAVISYGCGFGDYSGKVDNSFYISDLNSTNGTILNGSVVSSDQALRLNDNDMIVLGSTTLIFRL